MQRPYTVRDAPQTQTPLRPSDHTGHTCRTDIEVTPVHVYTHIAHHLNPLRS